MAEIKVKIVEMVGGYFRVIINDLPIAQYLEWDQANELVEHFIKLNADKKVTRD
ncbi:hypothetical protein ACRC6Q_16615 [Planococcus sp. SE5232]|uniref:hypothetical protein n=1 Tax=unclassified Planococcus (in: firmicutes) TaxID=2662419 RepID=UPI003D6B9BF6